MAGNAATVMAAAREQAPRTRAEKWLQNAVRAADALQGVAFAVQGARLHAIVRVPNRLEIDQITVGVARSALKSGRAVYRSAALANSDQPEHRKVYIGLRLRFQGRPAAIVLAFDNARVDDEAALLERVSRLVLRREEDKAANPTHTQTVTPAFTQTLTKTVTPTLTSVPQRPEPNAIERAEPAPAELAPPRRTPVEPSSAESPPAEPASAEFTPAESTPAESTPADPLSAATNDTASNAAPAKPAADLVRAQGAVIGAMANILDHRSLTASLHALANKVAHLWSCQRVAIGLYRGRHMHVEAMSGVADFDKRSALTIDIAQALDETASAAASVRTPNESTGGAAPQNHLALASQLRNPALMSVPLLDQQQVVGALLLERDYEFSEEEQQRLEQLALLAAPLVALKQLDELGAAGLARRILHRPVTTVIGGGHIGLKLCAIAAAALLACSLFFQTTFRVNADAQIEANVHRAVVANIDSFLSEVERRAGDIVYQGDVLARLDTEDLRLERIRWAGELDKLTKEYRATLAQRDRSNVRVLEAQRDQAQAQLDLLDAQLARAVLRAPIDGVVVSGDLSQLLGSPVERGQMLFEVATLDEYRLVLLVDESDVGWIGVGQTGNLRLQSLPDEVFPFAVTTVTPVSEPGEGANVFRVEADPVGLPETLRPGMGGVAKIDIEPRSIAWVWTHSFLDWAKLQLWRLGLLQ